jgi:hypothetical protein
MSLCKKAGQRQSIKIGNWSFEDVAKVQIYGKKSNRLKLHERRD